MCGITNTTGHCEGELAASRKREEILRAALIEALDLIDGGMVATAESSLRYALSAADEVKP